MYKYELGMNFNQPPTEKTHAFDKAFRRAIGALDLLNSNTLIALGGGVEGAYAAKIIAGINPQVEVRTAGTRDCFDITAACTTALETGLRNWQSLILEPDPKVLGAYSAEIDRLTGLKLEQPYQEYFHRSEYARLAVVEEALRMGITRIIVFDGADEIGFFPEDRTPEHYRKVLKGHQNFFKHPVVCLTDPSGIRADFPYLSPEVLAVSRSFERGDCEQVMPTIQPFNSWELIPGRDPITVPHNGFSTVGKIIIRQAALLAGLCPETAGRYKFSIDYGSGMDSVPIQPQLPLH